MRQAYSGDASCHMVTASSACTGRSAELLSVSRHPFNDDRMCVSIEAMSSFPMTPKPGWPYGQLDSVPEHPLTTPLSIVCGIAIVSKTCVRRSMPHEPCCCWPRISNDRYCHCLKTLAPTRRLRTFCHLHTWPGEQQPGSSGTCRRKTHKHRRKSRTAEHGPYRINKLATTAEVQSPISLQHLLLLL